MKDTTTTDPFCDRGLSSAVRAEWIKLRSVPAGYWSVLALVGSTVLLTVLFSAVGGTDATRAGQGDDDVVANSLLGVHLGQVAAVVLGVLAFGAEHATGMLSATFAARPDRGTVLAAKAVVVGAVMLVAGSLASVTSFVVAQPLLHGGGYVPLAYPLVGLDDPRALRAVVGSALFLTAVALLGLGVGAIVRSTSAAIAALTGLLLFPAVLGGVLPGGLDDVVRRFTPAAGLAIQQTIDRAVYSPLQPWAGLGVTWAWAAAALLLAWSVLRHRDA
jgi:ABC-2 type transport system permease protein